MRSVFSLEQLEIAERSCCMPWTCISSPDKQDRLKVLLSVVRIWDAESTILILRDPENAFSAAELHSFETKRSEARHFQPKAFETFSSINSRISGEISRHSARSERWLQSEEPSLPDSSNYIEPYRPFKNSRNWTERYLPDPGIACACLNSLSKLKSHSVVCLRTVYDPILLLQDWRQLLSRPWQTT